MKLRNKILLFFILFCFTFLFGNRSLATYDDYDFSFTYNEYSYNVTLSLDYDNYSYFCILNWGTPPYYNSVRGRIAFSPLIYRGPKDSVFCIDLDYGTDTVDALGCYKYVNDEYVLVPYEKYAPTIGSSSYNPSTLTGIFYIDTETVEFETCKSQTSGTFGFEREGVPVLSNNPVYDYNTKEQVFREAGGSSGGKFELQNPYGDYEYGGEGEDDGSFVDSDFEDSSDGGWLGKLVSWLKAPFKKLAEILAKIYNFFVNFIKRILSAFFDFFVTIFIPESDDLIIDDVRDTIYSKFPIIDSFKQILNDFNNAFDKETGCPTFSITLPAFLGGKTFNVIDFSFYNQYRSIINGLIIGTSYFFYIKKIYSKLPNIIKN